MEAIIKAMKDETAAKEAQLSSKLTELSSQLDAKIKAHNTMLLNASVNEAAVAAGVDPVALPAVKALASTVFKIENDTLVGYDPNDGSPLFSKDGQTNLSVREWAASLKDTMPQLFMQPKGAGTQKSSLTSAATSDSLTPLQKIQQGLGARK